MGNVAVLSCFVSKAVRVVHPNGKVYIYTQPISVSELLQAYPHHYLCDSEGPNSKATMVPQEMELEFGRTYVLVPLPRLFDKVKDVRHSRPTSCFPRSLCLGPGGQGFPTLSDSDDNEATFTRRAKGRVTLGSLLALHSGCLGLVRKKYKDSIRSPSALKLQRILAKAEMNWRCTCVETRSWRPELESIKEEARKNSLSRRFEFSLIENHRPLEPAP